jgi:superfamily II DNA or RNA helicase
MIKTVGQIAYDAKHNLWGIQAEPHVTMRLKKLFGRVDKHGQGVHFLHNTPEIARDLEWFMSRYPMQISDVDAARLRAGSQFHVEVQDLIHTMLAGRTDPLPFKLALDPRDYQRVPPTIVLNTGRLLLADDVGTGKTVCAICLFTESKTLPALVVTLTHLPLQWKAEINRFAPSLRVHILKKGTPYDLTQRKRFPFPDVIITSYSKLRGWAETLAPLVKTCVFDEIQELRHNDSAKYQAASHIAGHCNFRMGLSATPIYNYGTEFHSVINILDPGSLGSRDEFLREWCTYGVGGKHRISAPKAFGSYLRDEGLMLRRTRADVGRELPPIEKIHHVIEADTDALNSVSRSCAELARLILREDVTEKGTKWKASEEFSNLLRQATGIAKAPYVADFVRLLVESGEQVVLFGWHREVYSLWLDRLKDLKPVMYTGSESPVQKEASKQAFIKGESKVIIISLRAGAGLDGLQHVSRCVVIGELDWSPGCHEQNVGRVARDGQKDPVLAYFLVAESGSDPIVADVLGIKRMQLEPVRDPNQELVEQLTVDPQHVKKLAQDYLSQLGG